MNAFDQRNDPYAFVRISGDRTYGHMEVLIHNVIESSCYPSNPMLTVTSQIGSQDYAAQRERLYAMQYGVIGPGRDQMRLAELEAAVKFMRKFERRMNKVEAESGRPESFAELCYRVILCSGAKVTFINTQWNAGYSELKDLPNYATSGAPNLRDLRIALAATEATLISLYARQTA